MKKVEDVNILVIGDIMLDRYIVGTVEKISPEAPVPVVNVTREYSTLGGCGNVVSNLRSLGANVKVVARVGKDSTADEIEDHLLNIGADAKLVVVPNILSTEKIRIIAEYREMQMLRVDKETVKENIDTHFFYDVFDKKTKYDVIVVSDYNKGFITPTIMDMIRSHNTKECPVIVDPKPEHAHMYEEVFMITPNCREYKTMRNHFTVPYTDFLLETKGKRGMVLHDNTISESFAIKGLPVEISNCTGAGDTVVACMAVGISMGLDPLTIAKVANECAAEIVTQPGTTVTRRKTFFDSLKDISQWQKSIIRGGK